MIQDIPGIFWVAVSVALILIVTLSLAWAGLIHQDMIDNNNKEEK